MILHHDVVVRDDVKTNGPRIKEYIKKIILIITIYLFPFYQAVRSVLLVFRLKIAKFCRTRQNHTFTDLFTANCIDQSEVNPTNVSSGGVM
jgi:hypothetical protein